MDAVLGFGHRRTGRTSAAKLVKEDNAAVVHLCKIEEVVAGHLRPPVQHQQRRTLLTRQGHGPMDTIPKFMLTLHNNATLLGQGRHQRGQEGLAGLHTREQQKRGREWPHRRAPGRGVAANNDKVNETDVSRSFVRTDECQNIIITELGGRGASVKRLADKKSSSDASLTRNLGHRQCGKMRVLVVAVVFAALGAPQASV